MMVMERCLKEYILTFIEQWLYLWYTYDGDDDVTENLIWATWIMAFMAFIVNHDAGIHNDDELRMIWQWEWIDD